MSRLAPQDYDKYAKEFGVNKDDFMETRTGGKYMGEGATELNVGAYQKAVHKAMDNNFHVQYAMDKARDSGGAGANRVKKLPNRVKNPEDAREMHQWLKNTAKAGDKMGKNNYNVNRDLGKISDYWGNRDRDNLMRSIEGMDSGGDGGGGQQKKSSWSDPSSDNDLKAAQENYDKHFENGNPWAATSATDLYNESFSDTANNGRGLHSDAVQFMFGRADQKKAGVNRFIDFLGDANKLTAAQQHASSMSAIENIAAMGVKPVDFTDPMDLYNNYKDDIDDIYD